VRYRVILELEIAYKKLLYKIKKKKKKEISLN